MSSAFSPQFDLLQESSEASQARCGKLQLKHGQVDTPIFMPVGTQGCVKTLLPTDLKGMDAQIILGNTYHLFLRPGLEVIKHFGGLHSFQKWDRPILSDSGGFQVFSLGQLNKISEEGAHFRSHLDGTAFLLSPELAVEIQETLGSDIHMVFDECTPFPATKEQAKSSMERSMRWAKRCKEAKTNPELMQFGIVQGSVYPELRQQSCQQVVDVGFDGYAIGGLSVGEPKPEMRLVTKVCTDLLPKDKPRYLMGVGTPLDLIESVHLGVDMFDCVMPTRNGRNGTVFTSRGKINVKAAIHKLSNEPMDPDCSCYTCTTFEMGYLRHLYKASEPSIQRLLSLHNLHYYVNLMKKVRTSIGQGDFLSLLDEIRSVYPT